MMFEFQPKTISGDIRLNVLPEQFKRHLKRNITPAVFNTVNFPGRTDLDDFNSQGITKSELWFKYSYQFERFLVNSNLSQYREPQFLLYNGEGQINIEDYMGLFREYISYQVNQCNQILYSSAGETETLNVAELTRLKDLANLTLPDLQIVLDLSSAFNTVDPIIDSKTDPRLQRLQATAPLHSANDPRFSFMYR